jgi:hypothetical protein
MSKLDYPGLDDTGLTAFITGWEGRLGKARVDERETPTPRKQYSFYMPIWQYPILVVEFVQTDGKWHLNYASSADLGNRVEGSYHR